MSDDLSSSRDPNRRTRWWSRLFKRSANNGMARSDIVEFLGRCRRVNLLDTDEHAMLQGVLKVSETQVRDIMVPPLAHGGAGTGRFAPDHGQDHRRLGPFTVSGGGRGSRRGRRDHAGQGPAALFRGGSPQRRLPDQRVAAAGRLHPREQAPGYAAHPIPREPQSHGHRRRRIRRRRGVWPPSRTSSSRSSATSTTNTIPRKRSTSTITAKGASPCWR